MAQDSHLFTFPAGSDVACYLVPATHVYCTLRDSTLTSKPDLRPSCPSPAATSQPLSHKHGRHGAQGLTATTNAILSRSSKGLLLFPCLRDRARVVRTDRHPLFRPLHHQEPPVLRPCSVPISDLSNQHPQDTCPAHTKRSRYSPQQTPRVGTKHQPLPDKGQDTLLSWRPIPSLPKSNLNPTMPCYEEGYEL